MRAERDDPSIPAWSRDHLDSPVPPEIEAPYFDGELRAWVLSRHADILAAFRASSLAIASPDHRKAQEPPDEEGRLKMRAESVEALTPAQLRVWRAQLTPEVQTLGGTLPIGEPIDLMQTYARPLCLLLASIVTGISLQDAERLEENARRVSVAAAEPYDAALAVGAKSANAELQGCFHSGPLTLRDPAFVALAQTMPCMLGNAWFALTQFPQEWERLHRNPELMEQAIEELLRYAGLVRILKGERVLLRIIAGNRDPERFSNANQVDVMRRDGGHFTLGAGPHACVGANLIRMAAIAITHPLVQRCPSANLARPVSWQGGSGFRFPESLWVNLGSVTGEPQIANGE